MLDAANGKAGAEPRKFHLDTALDNAPFSALTFWVIFAVAAAVVLEAVNNNLLGLALPELVADWRRPRADFKYAVTFSMFGMACGAFVSGMIADKIGRRAVILASLPICGIATFLIGLCDAMLGLIILRFIVGAGFGGLLPVAASMAAEFSPLRRRIMAVSVPLICVSLGTALAGFLFNAAQPWGGWRAVFYCGGILPLILSVILFFALPESPRFMAQHRQKWPKLRLLLRRLGHEAAADAIFADVAAEAAAKERKGGVKALLQNGLAHDTIAVWIVSFFGIAALYAVYMWLPAMLAAAGVSDAMARNAVAYWFSAGGFIGAFLCAWGSARFGSRKVMIIFALGGAVSIFALLSFDIKAHLLLMSALLGLHGLFSNGVQVPLYAVFAHLYPTHIRATGASVASSVGKMGSIFAGFLGGVLSVRGYFILLTIFMMVTLAALTALKRHISPVSSAEGK